MTGNAERTILRSRAVRVSTLVGAGVPGVVALLATAAAIRLGEWWWSAAGLVGTSAILLLGASIWRAAYVRYNDSWDWLEVGCWPHGARRIDLAGAAYDRGLFSRVSQTRIRLADGQRIGLWPLTRGYGVLLSRAPCR